MIIFLNLFQAAQLNKTEQLSSSSAEAPEESPKGLPSTSAEPAGSIFVLDKQASDQQTETQNEPSQTQSSSSPIDLSTKKSPEPESIAGADAASSTVTTSTASQGNALHYRNMTSASAPVESCCMLNLKRGSHSQEFVL